LALHISDGVLQRPWLVVGFLLAGFLAWLGSRHLTEEEIPRVAVLSAAFFVASSIHVPAGASSVHLLLNGLVGIILGMRAAVAIPLGLFLQAVLFSHGGITALGVNCCVMTLPALGASAIFARVRGARWFREPRWRSLVGLLLGGLTVIATALLTCMALELGGEYEWSTVAAVVLIAHLPVAAVESLVMAATLNFLYNVKPEMLGITRAESVKVDSGASTKRTT
jgi:cobalt/nickel transport system permease protein